MQGRDQQQAEDLQSTRDDSAKQVSDLSRQLDKRLSELPSASELDERRQLTGDQRGRDDATPLAIDDAAVGRVRRRRRDGHALAPDDEELEVPRPDVVGAQHQQVVLSAEADLHLEALDPGIRQGQVLQGALADVEPAEDAGWR